ncbi:TraU family protein [Candidatus Neptunochlamydia vexilliferae]|uniref:Protein TraU n=1 Tax=Candidatus Neptunichlamydia vexilliferae TaxID=1651774 RepID=A0ABS0B0G6_9BACT|nr:TraU family protein [Candidatus Neptunochlamydia vexilliferae]MBF5059065.1 Protein TraU [Candidatus Neptunochlamydia vexilliferae]
MRLLLKCIVTSLFFLLPLTAYPEGKFINPVTDVCWSCLFPIHIGGGNVTPKHKDLIKYKKKLLCHCHGDLIGVPIAFWEPTRLIDVTRTPYKLMGLGGISIAKPGLNRGGVKSTTPEIASNSFYHVHYYQFPILNLLDLGIEFVCEDRFPLDIGYMSEFDPFWGGDKWNTIINPEIVLFANPLAQVACIADCGASSFQKPLDRLFWCAGCQGSLYPLTGNVSTHTGGIQASSLLVHRLLAKLHNWHVLQVFEEDNYCESHSSYRIKKSAYKTQLTYPIAQTKGPCNALGRSDLLWGIGKTYPYGGEDFVYLIWTKKHCCLDPYKIAKKIGTGG